MVLFKKSLFFLIISLFFLPCLVSAITELGASTPNPIVGDSFYVQLDVEYKDYKVRDFHAIVTYDKSALELESVVWIQSSGEYREADGKIYIDKNAGIDWNSGAVMQFKFKALKDGISKVNIERNGESHYSDGNIIGQSFAPVSINATKPSSYTLIGSLYVKGYTILPTFSKTNYFYNLTVPSNVTQVEVVAVKSDSRQTITGDGKKNLVYGDNKVNVTVKAQDGSSRTYVIMIHRTDNRTGDTSLKSLQISNTSLQFEKDKKVYETTVSRSVDRVLITARPNDDNATLTGTGEKKLQIGENRFTLTVTSSQGKSESYTIVINRSTEELNVVTESSKLQSLRVNNLGLDLSNDKTKWLFGVGSESNELNISAVPESHTAKVEILGNENLKEGFNIVNIKVTEMKDVEEGEEILDDAITLYTLIVYKNKQNALVINNFDNINFSGDIIYNTTNNNSNVIPKSIINNLREQNSQLYYNVVNIYNGILFQAVIKDNLKDSDLDVSFKKVSESPLTYNTSIPKDNEVTLYLADYFNDDSNIKIYTYNEDKDYTLLTDGITVKNGYVTFITNGDKNYIFTMSSLIKELSPFDIFIEKYKSLFIGGLCILILGGLGLYVFNKKNKAKKSNEPLY